MALLLQHPFHHLHVTGSHGCLEGRASLSDGLDHQTANTKTPQNIEITPKADQYCQWIAMFTQLFTFNTATLSSFSQYCATSRGLNLSGTAPPYSCCAQAMI